MPEVSVILPNYNHARYLPERIGSILGQTFRDFELIILDDCSTDNSREVIDQYKSDPRVSHIIINSVNSGTTFRQWNKGISLAKADYVWIAESDDSCDLRFLELAVKQMREHPTAGITFAQSLEIDELSGRRFISFSEHPRFRDQFLKSYFNKGQEEIRHKMVHENTIPNASGVLFRKSVYLSCGGADENMRLCGDWMLWTKMLMISDVCFIAEPLNNFRLTNISARNRYAWLNTFGERMKVLTYIETNLPGPNQAKAVEVAFIRRAFKSFLVTETTKALSFIRTHTKELPDATRKIFRAFVLSLKDRLKGALVGNR